ncbi:MAG: hypothetical protein AB7Q42_21300 [Acidimicrobiia bacterium]
MAVTYFGISADAWSLIFQAVSAVAVVLGIIFGIVQLRSLAIQGRFASVKAFQEILHEHSQLFNDIVDSFPIDADEKTLRELTDEQRQTARKAVDAQNVIGQLIEEGLVDARMYFSLTHVQIIRVCHLLRPYTEWVESGQGTAYGRRIHRIAARAIRYHDLNPHLRQQEILITRPDCVVSIHRPPIRREARIANALLTFRFRIRSAYGRL